MINSFAPQWLTQLDNMAQEDDKQTFLLIDGVFLDDSRSFIHQWPIPVEPTCALFFERANGNQNVLAASPWLLPYAPKTNHTKELLAHCDTLPAVICIRSREAMPTLLSRLKRWTVVSCGDMQFNFRFMDTRRLPAIHRGLTPQQRIQLFGAHDQWAFVNRRGLWEHLDAQDDAAPLTGASSQWEDFSPPDLDDDQFAALLSDSEPDEVVAAIWDDLPERCATRTTLPPADVHQSAQLALKQADCAGWFASPDRMTICRWVLEQDAPARLALLQDIERWNPDQTVEDALQKLEATSHMASGHV